ncbi:MAG: hypothetical protein ACTHLU_05255 [Novosphingobium sp.]
MRPKSIVLFDWLFLGSVVVSAVNTTLSYDTMAELFRTQPELAAIGDAGGAVYLGSHVFSIVISLLLWFFISRRASNVAKWILTALTALGVLSTINLVQSEQQSGLPPYLLGFAVVLIVLQAIAVAFLFRKDAAAWLAGKGPVDPRDFA